MTSQEFQAFKGLMTRVAGVLGKPAPDDDTAEFAFAVINNALPDVTISELTRAAFAHLKESRFYPTPSHLIDAVNDERDRNVPESPVYRLPPHEDREADRAAFEECRARVRAVIGRVGRPMPSAEPWEDDRTADQVARDRAEIRDQLAALTRRND